MITLGITGRSGCGKSTVTAVFAGHGVPLADADQISREILLPGSPLLPQLAARFGGEILRPDGTLDRRLLADRAFATPEGKAALDSLTHPPSWRASVRQSRRRRPPVRPFLCWTVQSSWARRHRLSVTAYAWSLRPLRPVWRALWRGTASRRRWLPAA